MTYELAKKLNDAGFPMPNRLRYDRLGMVELRGKNEAWVPNLEELIEACGDKFGSLEKVNSRWATRADYLNAERIFSDTPSEAVAMLYISLHKDNNE